MSGYLILDHCIYTKVGYHQARTSCKIFTLYFVGTAIRLSQCVTFSSLPFIIEMCTHPLTILWVADTLIIIQFVESCIRTLVQYCFRSMLMKQFDKYNSQWSRPVVLCMKNNSSNHKPYSFLMLNQQVFHFILSYLIQLYFFCIP